VPGITANQHYPYPVGTDQLNIAGDIKKLADAVDITTTALQSQFTSEVDPLYNCFPLSTSVAGVGASSSGGLIVSHFLFQPRSVPGWLTAWVHLRADFAGGSGYQFDLNFAGVSYAARQARTTELTAGAGVPNWINMHASIATFAGTGVEVQVVGSGTANITTYADSKVNRVDLIWIGNTTGIGPTRESPVEMLQGTLLDGEAA